MDTWAHMKNNMLIWLSSMSYGLNKLNAQRRGLANYADKKKIKFLFTNTDRS